eukprot:Awhi_evm1s14792
MTISSLLKIALVCCFSFLSITVDSLPVTSQTYEGGKFKVRDTNITLTREANGYVLLTGSIGAIISRGLNSVEPFILDGEVADALVLVSNQVNSFDNVQFACKISYDSNVYGDGDVGEIVGHLDINLRDQGDCYYPESSDWATDEIPVTLMVSYLTIPFIGFVNSTELDKHGNPMPTDVFKKEEGVGQVGLFNITEDGTFYLPQTEYDFCIPSAADVDASPIIASTFAGFALEWGDAVSYFSQNDGSGNKIINPNVKNVLDTINPSIISINGNSGMHTFLANDNGDPAGSLPEHPSERPAPVTHDDLYFLNLLARETESKLVLGLPMYTAYENSYAIELLNEGFLQDIDPSYIEAVEYGNEPDHWTLEKKALRDPANFTYEDFLDEFAAMDQAILESYPRDKVVLSLQGPGIAGCNTNPKKDCWNKNLYNFATKTRVKDISFHRYGQSGCSQYSTMESLLGDPDPITQDYEFENELAKNLAPLNKKAVLGETNALSCGGIENISDSFSASIWLIDNLLENGVRGVDRALIHATKYNTYSPFTIDDSTGEVNIQSTLYSLLQFSEFIGKGDQAHVYRINHCTNDNRFVKGYGAKFVGNPSKAKYLFVSKDWQAFQNGESSFTIKVNSPTDFASGNTAKVTRMTAPDYSSKTGIKVAGQSFGSDGQLSGEFESEVVPRGADGQFEITLDPVSSV